MFHPWNSELTEAVATPRYCWVTSYLLPCWHILPTLLWVWSVYPMIYRGRGKSHLQDDIIKHRCFHYSHEFSWGSELLVLETYNGLQGSSPWRKLPTADWSQFTRLAESPHEWIWKQLAVPQPNLQEIGPAKSRTVTLCYRFWVIITCWATLDAWPVKTVVT